MFCIRGWIEQKDCLKLKPNLNSRGERTFWRIRMKFLRWSGDDENRRKILLLVLYRFRFCKDIQGLSRIHSVSCVGTRGTVEGVLLTGFHQVLFIEKQLTHLVKANDGTWIGFLLFYLRLAPLGFNTFHFVPFLGWCPKRKSFEIYF